MGHPAELQHLENFQLQKSLAVLQDLSLGKAGQLARC
jgi:hypothetical protein